MSKWIMGLTLLALAGQPLGAQVIEGRVVESRTGRPLSNATVTVLDAEGHSVGMAGTDARGEFRVRLNAPGRYWLRTDAIGYLTSRSGMMNLRQGREVRRTIGMRTASQSPDRDVGRMYPPAPMPVPVPRPVPAIPPARDNGPSTSAAPAGDAERGASRAVTQPRRDGTPSAAPQPRPASRRSDGGAKRGAAITP
ncbi:MAG: carboxypeptidase-like regulatory domain-containing protein [Gemmatimonadetes bacterium]|nr:carboxypeptidase-like regulatory domain-containing protein [Gemmatimonadota bacterium]